MGMKQLLQDLPTISGLNQREILLPDHRHIYWLKKGTVDVFVQDRHQGTLIPIGQLEQEQMLIGFELLIDDQKWVCLARLSLDAELCRIELDDLESVWRNKTYHQSIIDAVQQWFGYFVDDIESKVAQFNNRPLPQFISELTQYASKSMCNLMRRREIQEQELIQAQQLDNSQCLHTTLEHFQTIFLAPSDYEFDTPTDDLLFNVCQRVVSTFDMQLKMPKDLPKTKTLNDKLSLIQQSSKVRIRQVSLLDKWWQHEHGPLLGFWGENKVPVALLVRSPKCYEMHNLQARTVEMVDDALASQLDVEAYSFYQSLGSKSYNTIDIAKFALKGNKIDLSYIIVLGLLGGLLSLVTPLITGQFYDVAIPNADKGMLGQLIYAFLASSFGILAFQITRGFLTLRVEGKVANKFDMAVWDRLIKLPVRFFGQYTSGELLDRVMGVSHIQKKISDTLQESFLAFIFSIFNLFLLFYYSWLLALVAIVIVSFISGFTLLSSYLKMLYQRKIAKEQGKLTSMQAQIISGLAKIRVAGAEKRVYFYWGKKFIKFRKLMIGALKIKNFFSAVNVIFPILASIVLFAFLAYVMTENALSTGEFLAYNAAFGSFLSALLSLTSGLVTSIEILPIYERAKPILSAIPESSQVKQDPEELEGRIELNHIRFSYQENAPEVLSDLSLQIGSGEFLAIVGPSGSGKSTLLRLLLGFETPSHGSIYYDGKLLSDLDLDLVRRQLGVVLQNGKVFPGDIITNIIGSSTLTIEDAWFAARMAGLEEDIKAMPMGMHTLVGEGGVGLSGGQRQRLLIARALVHKPKILLFDEATSALDNQTQSMVSRSIESLQTTRIVIAHRLSTIMHADRIVVLKHGKIVEIGTYEQLLKQDGLFTSLAKQQIV